MADERVVTRVLRVDGGGEVLGGAYIAPGESLIDWGTKQGLRFSTECRREPWTQAELDRGDLETTVAQLVQEFPDGDYPLAQHPSDEPCTYCEALRFLEDHG